MRLPSSLSPFWLRKSDHAVESADGEVPPGRVAVQVPPTAMTVAEPEEPRPGLAVRSGAVATSAPLAQAERKAAVRAKATAARRVDMGRGARCWQAAVLVHGRGRIQYV